MKLENILDIVKLIEQNPITRLNSNYQSKFIEKIKNSFTESQQHLFVASFYCYLNYKKDEFIIDLDNIWKWVGFSRKNDCKKLLEKYFIIENDYIIGFTEVAVKLNLGGRPTEKILLTINTFKKLCLKSNTKKSNEIHDYFIKMEEIFQELLDEESNELRHQLSIKDQLFLENQIDNEKEKHQLLVNSYFKKSIVYLIRLYNNLYKFGYTNNIKKRINELKRLMNNKNLTLIFCIESKNNIELENKLKDYFKTNNSESCKRITQTINDNVFTECIQISNNYDINIIKNIIIKFNKNIGENIEIKDNILMREENILALENRNIELKIEYNKYVILEEQLKKANERIKELEAELLKFKPIENIIDNNGIYPKEIYEKFVSENCELDVTYKCSAKELIETFKNSLQNTIYQEKINGMYDIDKYTKSTNHFYPPFKKEFYDYFEILLNYKASAIRFRDSNVLKSINSRGFIGIRLKHNYNNKKKYI